MTKLSELTTIGVGGEPAKLWPARSRDELIAVAKQVWSSGEPWQVLAGGSNLVFADELPELNIIQVLSSGIETEDLGDGRIRVKVQAGENWDSLVLHAVESGWAGIEALSGIPGSVGAAPIQNIGAYGQEVASHLHRVEFLSFETFETQVLDKTQLNLGYRDSIFKQGTKGIVTWVEFELRSNQGLSEPIAFEQLASALKVELGASIPLTEVREAVLKLRASKGMVLDPQDSDTRSCGSFFINPIVSETFARTLPADCPKFELDDESGRVKLSAAWLIEHSGIKKGFSLPGSKAAISSKHTLAITNRGGASAAQIVELAEFVQVRVANTFGVNLNPEPNLIGF